MTFEDLEREIGYRLPPHSANAVLQLIARAKEETRERCAVVAWNRFMDICKKIGFGPAGWEHWCAAPDIRKEPV